MACPGNLPPPHANIHLCKHQANKTLWSGALPFRLYGWCGTSQDVKNPLGIGGTALHEWARKRGPSRQLLGKDDGDRPDDDFAARSFEKSAPGSWGRNMFGPIRGRWPDDSWKAGGATSRRTTARFHRGDASQRAYLVMERRHCFQFVTEGIHAALKRAWDFGGTVRTIVRRRRRRNDNAISPGGARQ